MSLRERVDDIFRGQEDLDLTSGGIAGPLFYLSLPIVITNLLQTAYNLADTFWLGQYSTEALAAISFAFPMVFLLISLGLGISIAGSVLVAQHTGAGEERQAEYAASQTVTFAVIASLILGAFGYFAVGPFIGLLGASPAVQPLATDYMQVIALGLVFMFGFFVFISLMRGYGDTVTPMIVMFGTVVLNIVIDPFLIFGFQDNPLFGALGLRAVETQLFAATGYTGSGVEGAAIATVFSRALAMAVGVWILLGGSRGVQIHVSEMAPDFSYVGKLIRIGAPASVEVTGRAVSVNLMLFIVGLFSTTVVAGFGIGIRVLSVIFLPAIAVAQGVETMTGQNIGADEEDRAGATNHFAAKAMFLVLTGMGVVVFAFARPIVGVFTIDPQVVDVGTEFMRTVAPTFGFMGILRAYSGGFRGSGKTLTAAAIGVGTLAGLRLPLAWFAAAAFGPFGIWISFAISNVVGATLAFLWFRRGTWREVDITGSPHGPAAGDD